MDPPDLPVGLLERIKERERSLTEQNFYVLVWGSGQSSPTDYKKRLVIRDYLAELFGQDRVFMGEDERFGPLMERYGLAVAEAIQAETVDGVVVLDTSIGPHSELLRYAEIILGKAIVFVRHEDRASEGFARVAYDALKVEGYTVEEYESCDTIRRKARDFLNALRYLKACARTPLGRSGT